MPTIVTRYVDTRSPAGGNGTTPSTGSGDANRAYPNFSASLAATSASFPDLVAADIILKIECAGGLDASGNTYNLRYNTDSDRYLWITANSQSRHQGVWDTSKYTIANIPNSSRVIGLDNIRKVRFEGLQIENRSTNGVWTVMSNVSNALPDKEIEVIDCHLRSVSGSGNNGPGISLSQIIRKNLIAVNNIFHGAFTTAISTDYSGGSLPTVICNNTIFGAITTGISLTNAGTLITHSVYNNIVMMSGSAKGFVTSSGLVLSGNNISSDNTSPQTNLRNIRIQFANTASGDFRLIDRFSPAVNVGTNLSNDIIYPFTTDMAGNIRGTGRGGRAWDIGALEYQRPATVIQSGSSVRGNITITSTGTRGQVIGSNTW